MEGKFTKEMAGERELAVYIPPSYGGGRAFPVVYMQDSGDIARSGLNYLEHMFITGALPELIIVGVKPRRRRDEYTPWPAPGVASGWPSFGGNGDAYLDELAGSVKPYIDRRFSTLPDKANTALAGASLGALSALFALYRHADTFGKLSLLSASLWYEGVIDDLRRRELPPLADHKLYMYVGQLEGCYKHNIQHSIVNHTREASRLLVQKGLPQSHMRFVVAENATHDAMFFSLRFPESLQWLFAAEYALAAHAPAANGESHNHF